MLKAGGTLRIALGGRLAELRAEPLEGEKGRPGTRGAIEDFTAKSRRRLLRLVNSIDRRALGRLPLFVTLTYPAIFPREAERYKRDLDTLLKRVARAWPAASAIWRLELQARGAPHYHLLIFGLDWLPKNWVSQAWYAIVGSGDEKHLRAGTKVERVRSWRGVAYYAGKYLAKVGGVVCFDSPGRFWGVHNRASLPIEWLETAMTPAEYVQFRRIMRRYARSKGFHFGGHSARAGGCIYWDWLVALKVLAWVVADYMAM